MYVRLKYAVITLLLCVAAPAVTSSRQLNKRAPGVAESIGRASEDSLMGRSTLADHIFGRQVEVANCNGKDMCSSTTCCLNSDQKCCTGIEACCPENWTCLAEMWPTGGHGCCPEDGNTCGGNQCTSADAICCDRWSCVKGFQCGPSEDTPCIPSEDESTEDKPSGSMRWKAPAGLTLVVGSLFSLWL